MNFSNDTFLKISHACEKNSDNNNLLKDFLNQMSEFKVAYDNSKGTTRGIKRLCEADNCSVLFYDFERGNKYCINHSLTPYSPRFLELNRKITNLIDFNLKEKIFKNRIWNNKNCIRWLRTYRDDRSNAIQFKNCNKDIIQSIVLEIETLINKNIVLCTVPSSTKGKFETGINNLTSLLAESGRTNGINCLVRHKARLKNSYGGNRNLQEQLDTISSNNEHIIKDRVILLLDDVTATGNSMEACSQILKKNGAKDVYKFAIWKAGITND